MKKTRYIILAVMTAITAGSLLLFPKININEDMTRYLPDDSGMKRGVDRMKEQFPEIDLNAYWIKAMFSGVDDRDSLARELGAIPGIAGITSVEEKDSLILFQLAVDQGADTRAVASHISATCGNKVVVEHNANSIMPENMGLILTIGAAIVFGILFLMCSSIVEALLFILTIGMAVIINMGTNALLPSVSMMTNTIVAVLQLVLSMDYSIILMNRFRQVLDVESDIDKAMGLALKSASPSILSSSLTTIVGLLALMFMKFRIGMDLGIVLAKGVFLSLLSIYTILPALVLIFYKGIRKTSKKVFLIPTGRLAEFELRFRIPITVLFILIFAASCYLSGKTELSYASIWESEINEAFPPKNAFSILYKTSSEDNLIALADSLDAKDGVVMTFSYPSMFKKQLTAAQLLENIPTDPPAGIPFESGIMNEDMLRFLFYSVRHPQRDERMSLGEMLDLAQQAAQAGLLPEEMDITEMVGEFMSAPTGPAESEPVRNEAAEISPAPESAIEQQSAQIPIPPSTPEPASAGPQEATPADSTSDDPYALRGKYHFTEEDINTPMNSAELADYLGFSRGQAETAFAIAKKRNGTMTPREFIDYMIDNVPGNKVIGKMVSQEQAEGLYYIRGEMDKVLAQAPAVQPDAETGQMHIAAEPVQMPQLGQAAIEPAPTRPAEPTPMQRLAEMFAGGERYSAKQISRALKDAGIDIVDETTLNLMFAYHGSRHNYDESTTMSLEEIALFLSDEVAVRDEYAVLLDDSTRVMLGSLKGMVGQAAEKLRKDEWSMAAIITDLPIESERTFNFVESAIDACDEALGAGEYYLVGESVMYKEMKDGFKRELLLLTLLTVLSIFLIVALTFKSVLIPTILVMTVLTGVNINVIFNGLGGHTMLYLAYLIVQSILIGSTIDYGILFTNYYLDLRRTGQSISDSLKSAYRGSIHTIMTSGLIIILAPFIMSELLTDPTICSILSSLTFGALAVILLIVLALPALLASVDKAIIRRSGQTRKQKSQLIE